MASLCLLVVFPFLMAYAAMSDILTMTIPNRVSAALVGAFAVLAVTAGFGWAQVAEHALVFVLALAIGFALFSAGVIGGGDAKLAAATALWLGYGPLLDYVVNASMIGGLLALAILALRRHPLPASRRHGPSRCTCTTGRSACPTASLWRPPP